MPAGDQALQYTHSGQRYLLGYGADFFGIWDRRQPGGPVQRYPRTDDGWREAWLAFRDKEPYSIEVGIGGAGPAAGASTGPPPATRAVSGAWWLLPIFMGWLGGLIAWLVNKDLDPARARAMLITGIVISLVLFLLLLVPAAEAALA